MNDCEFYDNNNGWCRLSIDWSDPMPHPIQCPETYKCDQYVRDYPFYHCGHSTYEQACGYWCNYKNEWADTMSGYTGLCDDCKFNRYKQIIKE